MGFWGMDAVIAMDLISFLIAFVVLRFFISIPKTGSKHPGENVLKNAVEGIRWLRKNPGIFHLMLFLAAINLVASMYNAAFPAMMLSKASETAMGTVNAVIGITTLAGSVLATLLKEPGNRVKDIWCCLMLSMCTENFFLAFGNGVGAWCFGAVLGWMAIPWMNANLDAVNRLNIPAGLQGRVYAARNSVQFFTIPLGYLLGGVLVDRVFEPLMAAQAEGGLLAMLFGSGKGSGAALLFAALWLAGIAVCMSFRADRSIWALEEGESL